jgi:tetratricopeptide (TPR) repeat protein
MEVNLKKRFLTAAVILIMIAALSGCSKAGGYYSDGRNNFESGNYEKAAECYKSAIAANPNRADYYIDYGMTLIGLGKYQDALDQFDHAYMDKDMLIVKQNNKRILRGKGIAYYHMLQGEKAIEQFKLALKIDELSYLDMDILYYMADSLQTIGSYEEAIKTYTDILKIDDKNAAAYSKRACNYKNLGDYDKSLADYEKAIKLEPGNYEHYFGKYYLMAENDDDSGAAEVLSQAEKITAVTSEDKYQLAKVHFLEGNYDEALSELSAGYAGGFTEAYYYIGEIYRIQKDYEKAAYYYDIYMNNGEVGSSNVFNQMAICKIKLGDYEKALDYLEQGLTYHCAGTLQTLKKNEIIAYEYLGRYEEAKDKMAEYLISYPEDKAAKREAEFIDTRMIILADAEDTN